MAKMELKDKKCTTPKFRASYLTVDKPKSFEGAEAKYSVTMLFPKKGVDLGALKRAARNAVIEKWGSWEEKPARMRWPFRDGDTEKPDNAEYKGMTFVSASSKEKPGIIDHDKEDILDKSAVYSGCYMRATLIAFAYDTKGNKGVSFALQNLQKLGDGKKIGGRRDAKEDFDAVELESDQEENYSDAEESDDDSGF